MSVSHLASSESHTGTTGSTTAVPFSWPHTPGGTARGVTVFVWTNDNTGISLSTGVTYEGVTVPAVVGGEASRTSGETGHMKAYHLGSGIPTASPATVTVTRTGIITMWACCVTQAAGTDTEITGILLGVAGTGALVERNVDDGSPGSNSVRYAGGHFGYDTLPPAGANSTTVASMQIDTGAAGAQVLVETVPGQGSRPVGMATAVEDDRAVVYFAVREVAGVLPLGASESHSDAIGSVSAGSFQWDHTPGGTARGVLVFVWMSTEVSPAENVTYAGMAVPAVAGGTAHRFAGEEGTIQTFFLGANIPASDPATVLVTRQNTADRMWAVCVTVAAVYNTEVYGPGIVKNEAVGTLTEVTVTDGSPGSTSVRYAGGMFAYDTPPAPGPNSILIHNFGITPSGETGSVVRETLAGQGARPIGWVDARSEEKAVIYLALREILPVVGAPGVDLNVVVYGYAWPQSPIEGVAPSLATWPTTEAIYLGQTLSVIRIAPSQVTFTASPDHASVTGYTAELYTSPGDVLEGSLSLGVPTPDVTNTITADLAPLYAGQPAGDYYILIVTTTPSGSAPSEPSNVFTLPLT